MKTEVNKNFQRMRPMSKEQAALRKGRKN